MPCQHLLRPACGCHQDAPSPQLVPDPPQRPKRPGRARSPWRVRAEQEAADRAELETRRLEADQLLLRQVEQAVLSGKALQVLSQLTGLLARQSFSALCQAAWHVIEPATRLEWGRHHELLCTTLQALFEDWYLTKSDPDYVPRVLNTVINCPPGSLKSKIIAVFFPVWCWLRCPGMKFICLSVNETAAMRDARAARDLIRSDWFQNTFRPAWSLRGDQDAVGDYGNNEGGGRLSQASGSVVVGLRGDCVAGETLVSTEGGDVPIRVIHERVQAGQSVPMVWSVDHVTGSVELRPVVASRCVPHREVVDVRTQSNHLLRCTRDHKIFSDGYYSPAASLAGRGVSVLRRPDVPVQDASPAALPEMPSSGTDLRDMQSDVRSIRRRARQEGEDGRHNDVLQQELLDDIPQRAGDLDAMQAVFEALPPEVSQSQPAVLLSRLLRDARVPQDARTQDVRALSRDLQTKVLADHVLFGGMRGQSTLGQDDRVWELELLRESRDVVLRLAMGAPGSADPGARRVSLHRVPGQHELEGVAGPSYRRGSDQQCAGESDHSLRLVPRDSPQAVRDTVLSVDTSTEEGCRTKIDVYDIQVEGNHNFFANGILVHNCLLIDDANDPFNTSKAERQVVNSLWDDSQYSRVNDPGKSIRIGIQQRVHADDWTGHVISRQGLWSPANTNGWLHVVLPAEFELSRPAFEIPHVLRRHVERLPCAEVRDWRTAKGEVLHPRRMTPEYLAGEKRRWAGTGNYAGQMQQRPSSEEGGKIKKQYFGWFRLARGVSDLFDELGGRAERPAGCHQGEPEVIHAAVLRSGWDFDQVVLTVDPAVKKTQSGSLWGMLAIGYRGARRYVLDDRSARGEPDEAVAVLKAMVRFWNPDRILIEDKGGGAGMLRTLEIEMARGDVPMVMLEGVNPGTEDKELRANMALPTLANGMVFLLDGASWVPDFVEELTGFPNFSTDDRVDALTQCINHDRSDAFVLPGDEGGGWAAAGLG